MVIFSEDDSKKKRIQFYRFFYYILWTPYLERRKKMFAAGEVRGKLPICWPRQLTLTSGKASTVNGDPLADPSLSPKPTYRHWSLCLTCAQRHSSVTLSLAGWPWPSKEWRETAAAVQLAGP
jgi:hypothetical protein